MRNWLMVVLLIAVALSGCADESGTEGTDDAGDDGGSASGGGDQTAGGSTGDGGESTGNGTGNGTNEAPVVTFTADVLNGTAPLRVNFTLAVEDDAENLTWTFLIDGNETLAGEGAAAAFNHTFGVGAHNTSLVVSDGQHEVNETLLITAVAPAAPPGFDPVTKEFELPLPCTQCGLQGPIASGSLNPAQNVQGVNLEWMEIDEEMWGQPFLASGVGTVVNSNPELQFADACSYDYSAIATPSAAGPVQGIVPDDAGCLFIWENFANSPLVTITVQIGGIDLDA